MPERFFHSASTHFDFCWWDEGTTLRSGRLHKLLSVCRLLDLFFLLLLIAGLVIWGIRRRPRLSSLLRLVILAAVGIVLLISLQAGNNAVFDRLFPVVKVVNMPAGLDAR